MTTSRIAIYTHLDQVRSPMVIGKLMKLGSRAPDSHIIATEDCELMDRIKGGRLTGVALVDDNTSRFLLRHFEKGTSWMRVPNWALAATYLVYIGRGPNLSNANFQLRRAETCANLLAANFMRHFQARLDTGQLPWGERRHRKTGNPPRSPRKHRQAEAGCSHSLWL
ncbi:MAG: hypothetical protein AAB561_00665 [Patescibacteria group bacterium]